LVLCLNALLGFGQNGWEKTEFEDDFGDIIPDLAFYTWCDCRNNSCIDIGKYGDGSRYISFYGPYKYNYADCKALSLYLVFQIAEYNIYLNVFLYRDNHQYLLEIQFEFHYEYI